MVRNMIEKVKKHSRDEVWPKHSTKFNNVHRVNGV